MMVRIFLVFIAVIGMVHPAQDSAFVKDVSSVTYRFDTCGLKGRHGPSFEVCEEYYSQLQAPVLKILEEGEVDGIQVFEVPRSGLYHVTVAGASGGYGICQPSPGLGYVITVSVNLTQGERISVIVGQEGLSACREGNSLPQICSENWTGQWENCGILWFNIANTTVYDGSAIVYYEGGGGGGGATVLSKHKASEPLVVAAGGGGGGSRFHASYSMYNDFCANASSPSASLWVDAEPGLSGFTIDISENVAAGEGAGYNPDRRSSDQTDGRFLSSTDGPTGGTDCIESFPGDATPLEPSSGGFGGGGGGCENGGGGGGYTGGRIGTENDSYLWPYYFGEGGYSFVDDENSQLVSEGFNSGGGYVSIFPADCNCVGSCTLQNDKFYCSCPNASTLAPDGFDCYRERLLIPKDKLNPLTFDNYYTVSYALSPEDNRTAYQSFLVYSMMVSVDGAGSDPRQSCAVVLVDDGEVTGISTLIKPSDFGRFINISLYSVLMDEDANRTMLRNSSQFLYSPIRASHITTVRYGSQCSLHGVFMFVSVQEQESVTGTSVIAPSDVKRALNLLLDPVPVTNTPDDHQRNIVIIAICVVAACLVIGGVVFCLGAIVCVCRRRRVQRKANLFALGLNETSQTVLFSRYSNSDKSATIHVLESMNVEYRQYEEIPMFESRYELSLQEDIDFTDYNLKRSGSDLKEWEFPRENLVYMKELGEGQFGKVHLMKAKNICGHSGSIQVAVKILSNLQVENMKTFYEEMEVMKQFTHSNIVSFLGICSEVEDGAPMIILELMEFGDLKNFLIQHGPSAGHSTSLTTDHFYKFAADISSALSFLASKQYVHRDIAARNCLVGHGLCVKLADFGLARAVHEKDYYRVKKGSMLPLRWMAPESVKYGIFTLESDIWSCGVLLWEIASYAQHPYGNMSANELITAFEHESAFLPKPPDCPEKLYDVIQLCQSYPAEKRPKISELHLLFQSLLSRSLKLRVENI